MERIIITEQQILESDLSRRSIDIEHHIYSRYSEKKQAQDNGWVHNYRTKLVANGVANLEQQIVDLAGSFLSGSNLDEIIVDIDNQFKQMYKKLVKVAVKNQWCYLVIQEGKIAISEKRDPVYLPFPVFD